MQKSALKLAGNRNYFKPFAYPWAYDAFVQSEQMHWLWTEVPMMEDVKDFQLKLTDSERDFLTKILRFFTQGDIDVSGAYVTTYILYLHTGRLYPSGAPSSRYKYPLHDHWQS